MIKKGDKVSIRGKVFKQIQGFYPFLEKDLSYEVVQLDDDGGRGRVYCEVPGREDWVCFWVNQVKGASK